MEAISELRPAELRSIFGGGCQGDGIGIGEHSPDITVERAKEPPLKTANESHLLRNILIGTGLLGSAGIVLGVIYIYRLGVETYERQHGLRR